jgi:UDP-glucose 4-epimerase
MNNIYIVTGCAGFIGSNLVDKLLFQGKQIIGIDNFSTGRRQFLREALKNDNFKLIEIDLLDFDELKKSFVGGQMVFHFAANADVRFGINHPEKDLQQNTVATFNVLEAMRANGIKKIVFPSTGSVYGEADIIPTPENAPFPIQTSLYGASKLACEGLIQAYCEGFNFQSWIFRFVSILGERYTHGHVLDFYKQLMANPSELHVLGNGKQRKSYLYVQDCINAILHAIIKFNDKNNIINLGTNEYCTVNDSISWLSEQLGLKPKLFYAGGERGWVGDNPFIFLDTKKINNAGWAPKLTIKDAVVKTLKFLQQNNWLTEGL